MAKEGPQARHRSSSPAASLLYAEHKHSILSSSGVDAGGKDGTIKHVFGASIRRA